jgi:tetratricopeptide (TPR) repeat protein
MQLSHESYRARWLVLVTVWALSASALYLQARLVDEYLTLVAHLGSRPGQPPVVTPLKRVYPAFAADAQMWVPHALSLLDGNSVQLRYTTLDNAPVGREVHWNSAWAWTIAGAGWIHHLFTGQPLPASVERATIWLTPTVLFALIVTLSAWATRRAGAIAGVIVAIVMTCHDRIFEGFFPTYVDHHGLLTVAVCGLTLGAVFMGAGWWQENSGSDSVRILPRSAGMARSAAVFSALSGACGLWVSAASTIAPIAIVGLSGVAAIVFQGRTAQQQGAVFDAQTWRLWGRVGAWASVAFYLLEYFPRHLGLRLEPNHPFHALAWWGAGELIAQCGERWLGAPEQRWSGGRRLLWPVLALSLAPLTVLIGGTKVFTLIDPFLATLHRDYIQEFLPMWRTLRSFDAKAILQAIVLTSVPLVAGIATLTYRRRETPIVLWFTVVAGVLFTAMAWWQSRWLLNASGIQMCLVLVLVAMWVGPLRTQLRWIVAVGVVGVLFVPNSFIRYFASKGDIKARHVSPKDAIGPLNRDIAAALRASQPEGEIVLLSSPNSSLGIGYYGRFKTLGTLYWENNDGLKAAAAVLGAQSEAEAATLIRAHRITHIAIISQENFIEQYYRLLHPGASDAEVRKCFGLQLLLARQVPQWLQMLPYKVPDDMASLKTTVMLFKVNFNQNLAEAIYNVALTQISQDALEEADRTLDILVKQAPQIYQPWLRKAELQLNRHNWAEAAEFLLKGISLAPVAEREALYTQAGSTFYNQKQHALAIRLYQAALADRFIPNIASYLAWIFATSEDDKLRNGKEALRLAQEALKADPNNPSFLNVAAAALAELGRFPEAMEIADRSVANARVRGEAAALAVFQERLKVLQAGKPLRQ